MRDIVTNGRWEYIFVVEGRFVFINYGGLFVDEIHLVNIFSKIFK